MTIYMDLLLILNFIYDFLLLMTVSITLKRNTKLKRLLFGSTIGMISTLLIILNINKYILLILKIICSLLMIRVTYGYKNIKYFFNNLIYLYMSSVILAGFLYFLKIEFNNLSYLISLIIAPLILYLYIKQNKKLKLINSYYKDVLITLSNNKKIYLKGYIDSGNKLKDPITNKYIILINKNKLKRIYNIRSPIYVPINTVSNHTLLKCIKIKELKIDNINYNNYLLGLSDTFNGFDNIDCLLNSCLLEE